MAVTTPELVGREEELAELGFDHYEGAQLLGFHHHCALVTCAHAFLTLERLDPKARRPA